MIGEQYRDDGGCPSFGPSIGPVDQYAATLARWLGVPPANILDIVPNAANFPTSDLRFLV
ncbi:MAG: hypothetical protein JNN30_05585 [Rhodanobacteraceae bacterium]|nr:hypothetical protein [Rhodanobacteraceae bacterium]